MVERVFREFPELQCDLHQSIGDDGLYGTGLHSIIHIRWKNYDFGK